MASGRCCCRRSRMRGDSCEILGPHERAQSAGPGSQLDPSGRYRTRSPRARRSETCRACARAPSSARRRTGCTARWPRPGLCPISMSVATSSAARRSVSSSRLGAPGIDGAQRLAVDRAAQHRRHQLPGLAHPRCGRAQHQVGPPPALLDVARDQRRGLLAPRRKRPVEVIEFRPVPARLGMAHQHQGAHRRFSVPDQARPAYACPARADRRLETPFAGSIHAVARRGIRRALSRECWYMLSNSSLCRR